MSAVNEKNINKKDAPAGKETGENVKQATDNYINLKVKSQDGEEVFFKLKKTTQFKKLMDAYCSRQRINLESVRFLFDGERIAGHQTAKEIGLEDGDELDVVLEMTGGYSEL